MRKRYWYVLRIKYLLPNIQIKIDNMISTFGLYFCWLNWLFPLSPSCLSILNYQTLINCVHNSPLNSEHVGRRSFVIDILCCIAKKLILFIIPPWTQSKTIFKINSSLFLNWVRKFFREQNFRDGNKCEERNYFSQSVVVPYVFLYVKLVEILPVEKAWFYDV